MGLGVELLKLSRSVVRTSLQVMQMSWMRTALFAIVVMGTRNLLTQSLQAAGQTPGISPPQLSDGAAGLSIALPAGTTVEMALTRPVWAAKAKAGDPLYLQTVFPVMAGNRIGIPAGTFVQGTIDSIAAPTKKLNRAEIDVHFNQIIYADGYTVVLSGLDAMDNSAPVASATAGANSLAATLSTVVVQVSRNNDLLLDNGSEIEMTLEAPLTLDAARVAQAIPLSHAPAPGSFQPATLCRPTPGDPGTPGTPGTPDTIIPGTPGTPDTVIPGSDGAPDTVIPGTPATPATVIPGSPGSPGTPGTDPTYCPAPPLVLSSAAVGATPPPVVTVKQTPTPSTKKTRIQQRSQQQ
jgi:hypothetical protein